MRTKKNNRKIEIMASGPITSRQIDEETMERVIDIILPTKVHLVKGTVFPVVIYICEIWTIKKAELQTIDGFVVVVVVIYLIEANYFTILWWFLPYIDMNQPWVYMCSSLSFKEK